MNQDQLIGNWKEMTGEAKRQWGKLTDDSLTEINGEREKLSGKIQKAYGIGKEEAEKQIRDWENQCSKRPRAA